MIYNNPIIPGFYPDPSICKKDEVYYLVNSSFEYFPGVPIFKSNDMVNWEQIGNCLTRKNQLYLDQCRCSGGVFAPTIRYYDRKFYVITTVYSASGLKNFYVWTENPEGEWSDPIEIDIKGIDPSFYCENGRTYVQYTAFSKDNGLIKQVEIELASGKILYGPKTLTKGCGGRDVEGPHLWKRNDWYYLLLAEGGTREGHMVTVMRSKDIWGPFNSSPYNPVISNKDKGKELLQSIGHGDCLEDRNGNHWLVTLGTRPHKHRTLIGRETMLTPIYWTEDGWLRSKKGYMPTKFKVDIQGQQQPVCGFTIDFSLGKLPHQIISPRFRDDEAVKFKDDVMIVKGNKKTLDELSTPIFLAIRQNQYNFDLEIHLSFNPLHQNHEAGVSIYMDINHYFSFFITVRYGRKVIVLKKKVGEIIQEKIFSIKDDKNEIKFNVKGSIDQYQFKAYDNNDIIADDFALTKHITSECSDSPFTGVVCGTYVIGEEVALISKFSYTPNTTL